MRGVKNPLLLSPFYTPASGTLIPVYEDIKLQNVRDISPGEVSLLGIDAQHPLGVRLDGVAIDRLTTKDIHIAHARIAVGPGHVSFGLQGDDVKITEGAPSKTFQFSSFQGAFVLFPDGPVVHFQRNSLKVEEPKPFPPP